MLVAGISENSKLHAQMHSGMENNMKILRQDRKSRTSIALSSIGHDTWMEIATKSKLRLKQHGQATSTHLVKPDTDKFGWEDRSEAAQAEE